MIWFAPLNDPMTFTESSVGAQQVAVISIIIPQLQQSHLIELNYM